MSLYGSPHDGQIIFSATFASGHVLYYWFQRGHLKRCVDPLRDDRLFFLSLLLKAHFPSNLYQWGHLKRLRWPSPRWSNHCFCCLLLQYIALLIQLRTLRQLPQPDITIYPVSQPPRASHEEYWPGGPSYYFRLHYPSWRQTQEKIPPKRLAHLAISK